jgi:hypothetical protein
MQTGDPGLFYSAVRAGKGKEKAVTLGVTAIRANRNPEQS